MAARTLTLARLPAVSAARLEALAEQPWSARFYLAGSAALALHLGHRRPRGLDLMSERSRLESAERRDLMQALAPTAPGLAVETARDGYLDLRFDDGVPLRLYHYPYVLVEPPARAGGLAVASAVDLALMKLAAVISRGARRDFVDLFALCRRLPLAEVLARADDKFPLVRDFPLQALKGLADRDRARTEPVPGSEPPVAWDDVERWIDTEVRDLARNAVGLGGRAQIGS